MFKRFLFVLAAIALGAAGLYFRSANTKEARVQASRIVAQDTAGQPTGAALADLTNYSKTHMGATVSFTLDGAYARAQATAKAAAAATDANSQIYAAAQKACAGKSDSITQAKCNQDYLSKHLVNVPAPTPVPSPKLADYKRTVSSPLWAPDLSGALLLGAGAALVLAAMSLKRKRP